MNIRTGISAWREGERSDRRKVMEYYPRNLLYFLCVSYMSGRSSQKQLWYHDAVLFPPAALSLSVYKMLILTVVILWVDGRIIFTKVLEL
jgi:hypothetical protein